MLQELLVTFLAEFMPAAKEFQLPLKPAIVVNGLDVGRCKCMGSNAVCTYFIFLKYLFLTNQQTKQIITV